MLGSWPAHELPFLDDVCCTVTSKATTQYNCIAWAAGDVLNNWWPDEMDIGFWPARVSREETLPAFVQAYETLGYKLCLDDSLQEGHEKVAIFGIGPEGSETPTHAALQLKSGEWTSKLGPFEDISHKSVHDVRGPVYGRVLCYMIRRRPTAPNP
jgi:hypothetical protein